MDSARHARRTRRWRRPAGRASVPAARALAL